MSAYRILLGELISCSGRSLPLLICLMALVGLGEGLSVALFLPLLNHLGVAGQVSFIQTLLAQLDIDTAPKILLAIIAIGAVHAVLYVALNWWLLSLSRRYQGQYQAALLCAYLRSQWTFIATQKSGDWINAIVTWCARIGVAFQIGFSILATAVASLVYFGIALVVSWQVTVLLIGVMALSIVLLLPLYRRSHGTGEQLASLDQDLQFNLAEIFSGAKTIKANAQEDWAINRIVPIIDKLQRCLVWVNFMPLLVRGLLEFYGVIALASIVVLAGFGIGLSIANTIVALALFARLFPRISALQSNLHYLSGHISALEDIKRMRADAEAVDEYRLHEQRYARAA